MACVVKRCTHVVQLLKNACSVNYMQRAIDSVEDASR